jgi:hypothetical protein
MRNLIFILLLVSCNPVKHVLNHNDKRSEIITILKSQGICTPDTLTYFRTDTIIKLDTIGVIEIFTDTFVVNDTIKIITYKYRDILKTITVIDTVKSIVIDIDRVNALSQINSKIVTENELLKAQKRNYGYIALTLFAFLLLLLVLIIKK